MKERPTRERILMDTAILWAGRSTCDRLHVGAVIHREGRILVQGYNGAPAGLPHCDHECTCHGQRGGYNWQQGRHDHLPSCHIQPDYCVAVHAEQNAISWAARVGVGLSGSTLVCTHQPCLACARSIVNAGIVRVIFSEDYRLKDGIILLGQAGIGVDRFPLDAKRPAVVR